MTSPNTSMQVSSLPFASGTAYIDALVGGSKWGGGLGASASIAYSFAYANAQPATWYTNPGTGEYSADNEPSLSSGLGAAAAMAARGALQQWASVANLSFTEISETPTNVGDIRFAYTSAPAMSPSTWGWAYLPSVGSAPGGDVWINADVPTSDPDWSVGSYNFAALMHEIGHSIGLQHPFEATPPLSVAQDSSQYTLMSYTEHPHAVFREVTDLGGGSFQWQYNYIQPSTPMLYDIAAIQYMYGANMTYATGDDVYSFGTNTPFFQTIWDAGGNDTISIGNFTLGSTIDLHEGAFSSIRIVSDPLPPGQVDSIPVTYDGTDNLAIAFGAKIENAIGGSGNDTLTGNNLNNRLEGKVGNDMIFGDAGDDTLVGGNGDDSLNGGGGLDTASFQDAVSAVTVSLAVAGSGQITGGSGFDTLISIENLIGSSFNDRLSGSAANNLIDGGGGNDVLSGGAGIDTASYVSATGAVTVILALTSPQNTIGAGADTLAGFENLSGGRFNDVLTGSSGNNVIDGGLGNDVMDGGTGYDTASYTSAGAAVAVNLALVAAQNTLAAGTDTLFNFENLTGSNFSDSLTGSSGNNLIEGGNGNDSMEGGAGIDTVAYANAGAAVSVNLALVGAQNTFGAGTDTLHDFENLTGSEFNDTLTGSATNNLIEGREGNDTLDGGAGSDTATYLSSTTFVIVSLALVGPQVTVGGGVDTLISVENLTGSNFNDTLTGNSAANSLNGGLGADTLNGSDGNDIYVVDNADDVVSETNAVLATGGTDTVYAYLNHTLAANVENLRILATGAANGTGNSLNNILYAGVGNNVLDGSTGVDTAAYLYASAGVTASLAVAGAQATGGSGADTFLNLENLTGSNFNDTLTGNNAVNSLNGGLGTDTLNGGDGNDIYVVDNADDVVSETNAVLATGGTDTVYAYLNHTLAANVENLRILATGAANGTGNSLNNILYAGVGNNVLDGSTGVDTAAYLYASAGVTASLTVAGAQATGTSGSDTFLNLENLTGSKFNDTLTGNNAANTLNGGLGADTMAGGDGNDIYAVDNADDVVSETNAVLATGGTDTVYAYLNHTLAANVENLRMLATGAANGTGNSLNNILYAGGGNNVLNGSEGLDTASYLYASARVTASLGVTGAQATGGSGADTFLNIENLTGSNFNDTLTGNSVANTLTGGLGADALVGGLGADTFDFNALSESLVGNTHDTITDFSHLNGDRIDLATIDANMLLANNQAFSYIGDAAFSSIAGQLRCAGGLVSCDVNGDNIADFEISLSGLQVLQATDFVL